MPDGSWSKPAFVKLTGGSVGWQIGAESTDVVLVFANDNAVKNIASGKFTLGGEASAVAGPLRKQAGARVKLGPVVRARRTAPPRPGALRDGSHRRRIRFGRIAQGSWRLPSATGCICAAALEIRRFLNAPAQPPPSFPLPPCAG
jgi:hypothetical protein